MKILKFKFNRFGEQDAFCRNVGMYEKTIEPYLKAEYWYAFAFYCSGTFNRGYRGEFAYSIEGLKEGKTLSIAQAFLELVEEIEYESPNVKSTGSVISQYGLTMSHLTESNVFYFESPF